jgi:hypothetical protein
MKSGKKSSVDTEPETSDSGRNWNAGLPASVLLPPGWRRYPMTLAIGIGQVAFAIYLAASYWLNPVPDPRQLIRVPVTVLGIQANSPHLHVQMEDGESKMMEFPVPVQLKPNRYTGMTEQEQHKLIGCTGYVAGIPMRLVLGSGFRIWSIRCGDVDHSFEQAMTAYQRSSDARSVIYWWYWFVIFSTTAFVFWIERRIHRGSQK